MSDATTYTLTGPIPLAYREIADDNHDLWMDVAVLELMQAAEALRLGVSTPREIALALAVASLAGVERVAKARSDSANPMERKAGAEAVAALKRAGVLPT